MLLMNNDALITKPSLILTQNLQKILENNKNSLLFSKKITNSTKKIKIFIPKLVEGIFDAPYFVVIGLRGTLSCTIPIKFQTLFVSQLSEQTSAYMEITSTHSTDATELNNLSGNIYSRIVGVSCGYKKKIKIIGVGYKTYLEKNNTLKFILGYSHDVYFHLGSTISTKFGRKNNRLVLTGPSLPLISGVTAALHAFKKPDVYKGKGVRLRGVKLRKKEGKKKK